MILLLRRDAELAGVHFFPIVQAGAPAEQSDAAGRFGLRIDIFDVGASADPVRVVRLLVDDEGPGRAGELHLPLRAVPDTRLGHGLRLLFFNLVEFEVAEKLVETPEDFFPTLVVHWILMGRIDLPPKQPIVTHPMRDSSEGPGPGGVSGRTALIVGAGRGLGRATAAALAE